MDMEEILGQVCAPVYEINWFLYKPGMRQWPSFSLSTERLVLVYMCLLASCMSHVGRNLQIFPMSDLLCFLNFRCRALVRHVPRMILVSHIWVTLTSHILVLTHASTHILVLIHLGNPDPSSQAKLRGDPDLSLNTATGCCYITLPSSIGHPPSPSTCSRHHHSLLQSQRVHQHVRTEMPCYNCKGCSNMCARKCFATIAKGAATCAHGNFLPAATQVDKNGLIVIHGHGHGRLWSS